MDSIFLVMLVIIVILVIVITILLIVLLNNLNTSSIKQINEQNRTINQIVNNTERNLKQDLTESFITLHNKIDNSNINEEQKLENIRKTVADSLTQIRNDNDKKLEDIRVTVDEKLKDTLETRLTQSFKLVNDELEKVHKGLGEMQTLATGVGDLKKVLSGTKTRGILGEIQLGAILKEILNSSQYEENVVTVPGSKDRVEFAIKLPNDDSFVYLPIDAKFPAETYVHLQNAIESNNKEDIEQARKNLIIRLKEEAKDIHNKYISVPSTTDFGIMFLPTEGLYSESCNLGMMEILQREYKVTIAGPSTMAAILNALQMGFRTLAIQERSNEVWNILASVKTEFSKFEDVLTSVQSRLKTTSDELDSLVGTRTRQINRSLNGIENNVNNKEINNAGNRFE